MVQLKYNIRGAVEAEKFLADIAKGAQSFAGTSVAVGTPLPRGLFTDVGTSRGTPATHWLSGLTGQAESMAKRVLADKMTSPLELATALVQVGNQLAAAARSRARQRTGKLRGSVKVVVSRGMPGGRMMGRRR